MINDVAYNEEGKQMVKTIKRLIRKYGREQAQDFITKLLILLRMNNKYILFTGKKAVKNRVNINYCHDFKNLGDNISPLLVEYAASTYGIDIMNPTKETHHLYAVGSIITAGAQDCTIWGSGILNTKILGRMKSRKFDVRSVRGPLSRLILLEHGYDVPEIYGDPAILMPLIYNPSVEKKYPVSVITHMNEIDFSLNKDIHQINIKTDDYKAFVEEIKSSELIISSSLHGIIFAEIYGVKAILLKPKADLFKYYDYYYSTGRLHFPIATSIEEALRMEPISIPKFDAMRADLLKAFPDDLWR